ncbi:MAG TPA: hypothetical protein VGG45_16505 [Terracidiphilus sp.]|jgi:hypothetical protein
MSLSTWFANLEAEAKAAVAKLEGDVAVLAAQIGPVVVSDLEAFLSAVGQIAIGAVLKQAPLVLSGAEKFGAAVVDVVQQVEIQGKAVAVADAQFAVQAAYRAVQTAVAPAA